MSDLYNIYIRPRMDVTHEQVEEKMNLAIDWFRYGEGCYLVWTSNDATKWYLRLKSLVEGGGHVLVTNIDPEEYNGWMPKDIWPWLADKKKRIYGDP